MHTGLSDDLDEIDYSCETAVIDHELHKLNIDVAALQEIQFSDSGSLKEKHYTLFWQGRGVDEYREHGFSFRISLHHMIVPLASDTERILTLHLSTYESLVNLVCIYAPAFQVTPEVKDKFYA